MKKTILFSTVFAAVAAMADGDGTTTGAEVTSDNTFAVQTVSATTNTILAVPFVGYGADYIKVSEIIKTANLEINDKLYAVKSSGGYYSWTLSKKDSTYYWAPDKQVTIAADGSISEGSTPDQDTVTLSRGQAFWLVRNTNPGTAATAVLMGQDPNSSAKVDVDAGAAWNLVAPSGSESIAIADIPKTTPTGADKIITDDGRTYMYTRNGWRKGAKFDTELGSSDVIAPGHGFWYIAKTAKTLSL